MTTEDPSGPIPELDALGVPYHMEYGPARARFVRNFQIPWTPTQWVGVVHREGQWLGVCCGIISAIRDCLMSFLANGGWVTPRELEEVIGLLRTHDGFMEWFEAGFTPDPDTRTNPLYLLVRVWDAVKDRQWASWMDVPERDRKRSCETAARSLEDALRVYGYVEMFHSSTDHLDEDAKRKANVRHQLDVSIALSRVIPALREFTDSLKWRTGLPIDGVAIVRKEDRGVVLDTRRGPCIYPDETEANKTVEFWCTNDQDNQGHGPPKPEDFELRPVRVTLQKGIEFLDSSSASV